MFTQCLILVLLSPFFVNSQDCDNTKEVVCYWGSWSIYRPSKGEFNTEYVDPTLCTNFIYTFAGLDINYKITSLDYNEDVTLGGFSNMTLLKEINPCLKTTLAIGGWNAGSLPYSFVSYTELNRENFADSVVKFLIYYGFDGLDLDWEYPTSRGGLSEDKDNFVLLLKAVKERLKPWNLRLTIAVPMDETLVSNAYDVPSIADVVDFVHLMAYDYTPSNSAITGLNSPLSAVERSVEYWLRQGLPSNKLILGIPSYGRAFILEDESNNGIGAPTSTQYVNQGPYTREDGFMAYYEILAYVKRPSYCVEQEEDGNKWAYCEDEWYSYDDEDTIQQKVDYALENNLGGIMMWSIDTDDFRGDYGDKYPLLNTINKALGRTAVRQKHPKRVMYPKTTL